MSILKKILLSLGVVAAAEIPTGAAEPDFAHPRQVLSKAYATLQDTEGRPDAGPVRVRALLEICTAARSIDPDSVFGLMRTSADLADKEKSVPARALMELVEARLTADAYSDDRWRYDRIDTPAEPLPADPAEWNGVQWRARINALTDKAYRTAQESDAPLKDYAAAVEADERTLLYFPTVADFVASEALYLYNITDNSARAAEVVASRIAQSPEGSPEWFYWSVSAITMADKDGDALPKLLEFYLQHKADEYARIALEEYAENVRMSVEREEAEDAIDSDGESDPTPGREAVIQLLEESLERFPRYWNNNALRNTLAFYKMPVAHVSYPSLVCPGVEFTVTLNARFAGEAGAYFYKIAPSVFDDDRWIDYKTMRPSATVKFKPGKDNPLASFTQRVKLTAPGVYGVDPYVNSDRRKYIYTYDNLVCTPYVPVAFTGCKEQVVVMADFANGKPVEGVRVLASRRAGAAATPMGTTNASGIARFKTATDRNYRLSAITPSGETLFFGNSISLHSPWRGSQPEADTKISAKVMPARAIYHPGEVLEYAVVANCYEPAERTLRAAMDLKLEATLLDANRQPVDTTELVTDEFGRAFSSFALPTDGLTGNYTIRVSAAGSRVGMENVMVSDYRMPTFKVEIEATRRDAPERGDVTIEGVAKTYSGMPVADAVVDVNVSEAIRWRWWQPSRKLGSVQAHTDATGRFSAVLPSGMLSAAHDFLARVLVTASTAETAEAEKSFTTGRPYLIVVEPSGYIKATGRTPLPVKVYGPDGKEADLKLNWRLVEKSSAKAVAHGSCSSLSPVADLDQVHGGYYRLIVEAADPALADKAESAGAFTLYNVSLNSIPSDLPLLVESSSITADEHGHASVQYGVAHNNTWVYAGLCVGDEIVEVEAQKRSKGFRHLTLDLPGNADLGKLVMFAISGGRLTTYYVDVRRKQAPGLEISAESFRDRLVPGSRERWTVKVKGADGHAADAAMVSTMYNEALDELVKLSWPTKFSMLAVYPNMSLSTLSDREAGDRATGDIRQLREETLRTPELRYWLTRIMARNYSHVMMKMAAAPSFGVVKKADNDNMVVEESAELEEAVVSAGYATADSDGGLVAGGGASDAFDYREPEVAQAFWRPDLNTDAEGNVVIEFDVPNANTTWSFEALSWTQDMKAAYMLHSVLASKPVMVQPNMPRFLRSGDKASVPATIFNNTDSTASVSVVAEVFDPATMEVVARRSVVETIEPFASAVVAVELVAPDDASSVGYRVRAKMGEFADGEQALIPVESSFCDVVESVPFYLNPGDKAVKVKVPKDEGGRYTLQYCQNPSWSIVKALPGLVTYEPTTTPGAVHAIFAAATARGVVERTPAVAEAIAAWGENDLTSRLAQNDALKIATLKATPWVQAAQSDSERMARLSLLLDSRRCKEDIDKAMNVLQSLQAADGGFRWGKWCDESSMWPTESVLHDLGLLRMAGYLPDGMDDMVRKALDYMDRSIERSSDKKVRPDMSYAVVRSMWRDVQPSAFGRRVVEATLNDCAASWRKASTAGKANMAILLNLYGRNAVAREIISSVDEFAVPSPSQGVSFPSVDDINQYAPLLIAYGKVAPASKIIDGMRQWLVVREQSTVGLGAFDATQLIAAFLNSGTPWHTDNAPAAVQLASRSVDLGDACAWGGEATVALQDAAGKTLTIAPAAGVPSYGALISSYRALPSQVKAASCEAISIEKRLMAVAGDSTARYADRVPLGQRVRVVLTLHVDRDMQYVTIVDNRAAALEPLEQLPGYVASGGVRFYRENRDAATSMFISYLPKGVYQLSYDCVANNAGEFSAGLATVQSALAPALTAHSAGASLIVEPR